MQTDQKSFNIGNEKKPSNAMRIDKKSFNMKGTEKPYDVTQIDEKPSKMIGTDKKLSNIKGTNNNLSNIIAGTDNKPSNNTEIDKKLTCTKETDVKLPNTVGTDNNPSNITRTNRSSTNITESDRRQSNGTFDKLLNAPKGDKKQLNTTVTDEENGNTPDSSQRNGNSDKNKIELTLIQSPCTRKTAAFAKEHEIRNDNSMVIENDCNVIDFDGTEDNDGFPKQNSREETTDIGQKENKQDNVVESISYSKTFDKGVKKTALVKGHKELHLKHSDGSYQDQMNNNEKKCEEIKESQLNVNIIRDNCGILTITWTKQQGSAYYYVTIQNVDKDTKHIYISTDEFLTLLAPIIEGDQYVIKVEAENSSKVATITYKYQNNENLQTTEIQQIENMQFLRTGCKFCGMSDDAADRAKGNLKNQMFKPKDAKPDFPSSLDLAETALVKSKPPSTTEYDALGDKSTVKEKDPGIDGSIGVKYVKSQQEDLESLKKTNAVGDGGAHSLSTWTKKADAKTFPGNTTNALNIQKYPLNCKTVILKWNYIPDCTKYNVCVENTSENLVKNYFSSQNEITIDQLSPGKDYSITIAPQNNINVCGRINHRTVLVLSELHDLYTKAISLETPLLEFNVPITHMYRNKPKKYFDDILQYKNGIMKKYTKDFNGDPGCPINGAIKDYFLVFGWISSPENLQRNPHLEIQESPFQLHT